MNRRRAMTVLVGGALGSLSSCKSRPQLRTFSSIAFGTQVHFQTHGISESLFEKITEKCSSRLREIEYLFSLYVTDSAISRLNRDGKLENPAAEFLKLIRTALDYGEKTGGIFDITVQPLWDWRQKWKASNLDERKKLEGAAWSDALAAVDYRKVLVTSHSVVFENPGIAISLNGIVQGYATDQIISLLKEHGIENALVNIGEYAAIGNAPDGKPWKVELTASGQQLTLPSGRALAVSAGSGHTFDPEGRFHHIFRPSDGSNTRPESTIVVTAQNATTADALGTTFAIASAAERRDILAEFPKAEFQEIK